MPRQRALIKWVLMAWAIRETNIFLFLKMLLADISNTASTADWLPIVAAVVFAEAFFIAGYTKLSPMLDKWYKTFGLCAVLADCLVILIGFAIARAACTAFGVPFSPMSFIGVLLAIQVLHDVVYYFCIVVPFPDGANRIMDYMKAYGPASGVWAILGDSSMMLVMGFLAMALAGAAPETSVAALLLGLYAIPYLLN